MHAWRITKAKHAATAFSGVGAKTFGGRWNSPGTPVVYTAASTSLAILEMLVHLQAHDLLQQYVIFEVTFDEALVKQIESSQLPRMWRRSPPTDAMRRIGDDWVAEAASPVLRLPSAIVPTEWNYLLNPAHADFAKIVVGQRRRLAVDRRLLRASPR